jgi:hypothetical protein
VIQITPQDPLRKLIGFAQPSGAKVRNGCAKITRSSGRALALDRCKQGFQHAQPSHSPVGEGFNHNREISCSASVITASVCVHSPL